MNLNIYGTAHTEEDVNILAENGFGIEIQQYMNPIGIESFNSLKTTVQRYAEMFSEKISMHGICYDMNYTSLDPLIQNIVVNRFKQSCEIAAKHNIKHIVFHSTGTRHELKTKELSDKWITETVQFWHNFNNDFKNDLYIYLENSEDADPILFSEMIKAVSSENIRCCLDIGHAYILSKDLKLWISALESHISYIHLHDNDGRFDFHNALGDGVIPLKETISQLQNVVNPNTPFILECDKTKSISWLKKEGFISTV